MRGYTSFGPGGIRVVYVPGDDERTVAEKAAKRVTHEYGCGNHRANTPSWLQNVKLTDWDAHGIWAVIVALALGLIVDGVTLLLISGTFR
jgi:hypothetical protein